MKIYNFSAGPACLPEPVLNATQKAAIEYKGTDECYGNESPFRSCVDLFHETTSRVRTFMYHLGIMVMASGGASMPARHEFAKYYIYCRLY